MSNFYGHPGRAGGFPVLVKSWEITGPEGVQHGLSVFEFGKDGWTGSSAMIANADRGPVARRRYIEKQRDGLLLYQK